MKQYIPANWVDQGMKPVEVYRTGFPLDLGTMAIMLTGKEWFHLTKIADRKQAERKLRRIAENKGYRVVKSRQRRHVPVGQWRYRVEDY